MSNTVNSENGLISNFGTGRIKFDKRVGKVKKNVW